MDGGVELDLIGIFAGAEEAVETGAGLFGGVEERADGLFEGNFVGHGRGWVSVACREGSAWGSKLEVEDKWREVSREQEGTLVGGGGAFYGYTILQ